jgi:hypothetical protein
MKKEAPFYFILSYTIHLVQVHVGLDWHVIIYVYKLDDTVQNRLFDAQMYSSMESTTGNVSELKWPRIFKKLRQQSWVYTPIKVKETRFL